MTLAADLLRMRINGSRRSSRSIRARLMQIVFTLVAPWAVGLAILAFCMYQNERSHVTQSTTATARALVSALNRELASTTLAAQVFAASPLLASDDFAAFHHEATKIVPLLHAGALVLTDATGQQLANTFLPYGEVLPLRGNMDNLRKVFETGQPSVSDVFIGPVTKRASIVIEVPVFRDNQVKYTLGVGVFTDRLNDLLSRQQLPPDWVSTIIDASGVIVARSRDPELVGKRASPLRLSAMTPSRSGVIEITRPDGTPIFVGFRKSDVSNWTVAISVPVATLSNNLNVFLLFGSVGVIGALIAGLILAFYQSAQLA
jgi:hypothetical protein